MSKVLVIGAARSGLAAARLLSKLGEEVTLTDLKKVEEKEELENSGIRVLDEGHPDFLFEEQFDSVIKNPGIPYHSPLVANLLSRNIPIYTEIDLAARNAKGFRYGAITGTDGKTTITTLLHRMLQKKNPGARAAGNIGTPLSELVLEELENIDVALELSNFQLLGMENFHAHAAAISNLAPDHLDYMKDLEAYYRSKFRITQNMEERDYFLRNVDDETIVALMPDMNCSILDISMNRPAEIMRRDGAIWFYDQKLFDEKDLHIPGVFNLMNAAMAASMAYILGVHPRDIQETIREFQGLEHRIEYLGDINGIRIYNDSKSTSSHSTQAALSAFDRPVFLLAGGFNKGIDYTDLKAMDDSVLHAHSFGAIRDTFQDIFSRQTSHETMEEALDAALEEARPGDVILLSPATSSFDQFRNYEERGRVFKDLVEKRREKSL